MEPLYWLRSILVRALQACAGVILGAIAVVMFADVALRYLFQHPLAGLVETTEQILLVGMVFLALPSAHHPSFSTLVERLPGRWRRGVTRVGLLVCIGVLTIMAWQGVEATRLSVSTGEMTESVLPLPIFPARVAMVAGTGVFALGLLLNLLGSFLGKEAGYGPPPE